MNSLKHITIAIVTDGSGDFTIDTIPLTGRILQVLFKPGTLDTGGDLTIVGKDTALPILTLTAHGTSTLGKAPRQPIHDSAGVVSRYVPTTGEFVEDYVWVNEPLTITEDDGGDTKAGTLHIWVG